MSAVLSRRPDYRSDAARLLRDRIHADLRNGLCLVEEARRARENQFWSTWERDFIESVEGLRHG